MYGESGDEDTIAKVNELVVDLDKKRQKLPKFTITFSSDDGESQSGPRRKRNDGDSIEQLEACGYDVVPDVLETDGGTWELLHKVQT